MRLNLYILADYLTDLSYTSSLHSDKMQRSIAGLMFYNPKEPIRNDCLYILSQEELDGILSDCQAFSAGFLGSFLCIGKPSEMVVPKNCDILYFSEECSVSVLFNKVQEIMLYFDCWEENIERLTNENAPLKQLAEACLEILDNPLCVATSDFRTLTFAEHAKEENFKMFSDSDVGQFLSDEEIDAFKFDPDYISGIQSDIPTMLNNDYFGFRHFYLNIFLSGVYIARVVLCEVERPIRQSDYPLIAVAAYYFKLALQKEDYTLTCHPKGFDNLLYQLLNGIVPENFDAMHSLLLQESWEVADSYFLCVIQMDSQLRKQSILPMCHTLENTIKGCIALTRDELILLIVNVTKSGSSQSEIVSKMAYLIRENLLKAAVSNLFCNLTDLQIYFQQACELLRLGNRFDPTIWCYRFEKYALHLLLLHKIDTLSELRALCPEKLQKLMRYDAEHKRRYTETLKIYLQHNMSVVQTTKALFMQRATLLYQLKRISEISEMNLNDYDERLYLMIYFKMMEYEEQEQREV